MVMESSIDILMAFWTGMMALIPVVIILALTRNGLRLLVGLVGYAAGYVLLGTRFAHQFAEDALRRGACPDAGWLGPAAGGLLGVVVVVAVFEVVRAFVRKSTKGPRPRRSAYERRGGIV
jgi:hypothetical protein